MRIIGLNQDYYEKIFDKIINNKNHQIQDNKNGRRPYFLSISYKDKLVLLPFRSNAHGTPKRYKVSLKELQPFKKHPAIDVSKMIIIDKKGSGDYIYTIKVNKNLYKYLLQNKELIANKVNKHIKDYVVIRAKNEMNNSIVDMSTLQYFHQELNLDKKIQEKRKQIFINEYENKGATIFFNNIVQKEPNFKNLIQLLEYKKLCQNESFVDPKSDLENPKLVIQTNEKEYKSISLNTINHLVETNNVSKLNDYFLLSKTEKSNKPNKNKDNFEI